MAGDTRERMIAAATELFRERGYDGSGFRDVVERAGAPRGSIYHHFPGGKTELAVEVALAGGERMAGRVERVCATATPAEAVEELIGFFEHVLVGDDGAGGCPILAITLAAEDPTGELRAATHGVYQRVERAVVDCLTRHGVPAESAESAAITAIAAAEGALVLARAARSPEPLARVRRTLRAVFADLARGPRDD